ncbi:hypothetical protein SCH4B_4474 [Ruegeria sp. TrichCH4B]|nr:hypothetical protein SCH4B_4474 [Ruegeria sp. TrichCH4B]
MIKNFLLSIFQTARDATVTIVAEFSRHRDHLFCAASGFST